MASPVSCTLWWANLQMFSGWMLDMLNSEERSRRNDHRYSSDRHRFILGASVLRLAVASELGTAPVDVPVVRRCADCDGPHGRPVIPGSGLHVSVSHSGKLVLVAVTRAGPVGVDVEEVADWDYRPLLEQVLAGPEVGTVRCASDFFVLWSRKESVIKATGDGLHMRLSRVELSPPTAVPRLLRYDGRVLGVRMTDLRSPDGYAAAATVLTDHSVTFQERCALSLLGASYPNQARRNT